MIFPTLSHGPRPRPLPWRGMSTTQAQAELTGCQTKALDILERQGNVFLTGAAGTGKSFLLHRYLRGKPTDAFPIVASTGAAAVLVGGRTFHSFFGLGIMEGGVEETVLRAMRSRKLLNRLQSAVCVVIDEISMLSGATLYAAERIARAARQKDEPWGGLRIIAVGDFAQLPPVTPGAMQKDWAFLHPTWKESAFLPALLDTVMRTKDGDFLDILNAVRSGTVNDDVRTFLDAHTGYATDDTEGTRLYAHRARADDFNRRRLDLIPGQPRSFETEYAGDARAIDSAKRAMPIPDVLQLKEGALVMMRKNDPQEPQLFVNGSLGHVRRIEDELLVVELLTGDVVEVEKQKFSYLDGDGKELVSAWNFPVTLAWATTIHKAQGASLDSLIVDLSALWEPGQAYVALSRVRNPGRLYVERWNASSIRAEPLVTQLYDAMAEEMGAYVPRPLFTFETRSYEREDDAEHKESPTTKGQTKQKRAMLIREMLAECAPFESIVERSGVKPDRVLLYIEEFIAEGIPVRPQYLLENVRDAERIREAFEQCGLERLKPAFESLGGKIPFTTLRMVRCAMMAEAAS